MQKAEQSNVVQIISNFFDFLLKVINLLLVPAASAVAGGAVVTGAVVFVDSPFRDMAIRRIAEEVKGKIAPKPSDEENNKINQQFEKLKRILEGMNTDLRKL